MADNSADPGPHVTADVTDPLTFEEDSELRRLHFMARIGTLSEESRDRLAELRLRDRRKKVREPREFGRIVPEAARRSFAHRTGPTSG